MTWACVQTLPNRAYSQRCSGQGRLVERIGERAPAEHGALDAHRELHDTLEGLEIAEVDVVVAGLRVGALDHHHRTEATDHRPGLTDRLADHGLGHHRRRRLRDRTSLAADLHIGHDGLVALAVDEEEQRDLVAAQWVVTPRLDRGWRLEFATVPRRAVVVENDFAVEVVEAGHQNPKISLALSRASARVSTSS